MTKAAYVVAERVRELLDYEPLTGILTWRQARGGRRAGAVAGTPNAHGHLQIQIDGRNCYAHIVAWTHMTGAYPTVQIDHKDRDPANNRWLNLRPAPGSGNHWNRDAPRTNTSGHKGVSWDRRQRKWRAYATAHRRQKTFGYFVDIGDAVAAHAIGVAHLHGEFAA